MKNKIIFILLAIIIAMGAFIGGFLLGGEEAGNKIDSVSIEQSISELQELATIEYNYTNMGKFENHKEFYGYKIPFTTSKFIITYDGTIKAGIDLSKVKVETNETQIILTLPDCEILSHEIHYDSLQILDQKHSIFNPFEITDYNEFYNDQSKVMEEKAIEKGLLEQAEKQAQLVLKSMVDSMTKGQLEVIFK